MYRFLLRSRWIVFTLVIVVLMVAMVNLGLWQLRRLDERRAANRRVTSGAAAAVVSPSALPQDPHQAEWRRVQLGGTWQLAGQVLIRNRSQDGQAGFYVVTPLVTAPNEAVLVARGFIPAASEKSPPAPQGGEVTVVARVRATQTRGTFGPRDPATGTLSVLSRVDVARIQAQSPSHLAAYYAELITEAPQPQGLAPEPIPLPALDEGPHLSYAVQWFLFTLCAAGGWVVVVRTSARRGGYWRKRTASTTGEESP